jgi:ElaB/YqjD/DUF883 family membrane-anchored ribosome-binding protein
MGTFNLGDILPTLSGFYDQILAALAGGKFTGTTQAAISILLLLAATWQCARATMDWVKHHSPDGGLVAAIVDFGRVCGRIYIVWSLVAASPWLVGAIASAATNNVRGLNTVVAAKAQTVLNNMGDQVQTIWECQAVVSNNLAELNPWIFDGLQDGNDAANSAAVVQQALQRNQQAMQLQIQTQLAQAQKLISSNDPKLQAQGQAIKSQANQAMKNLQNGIDAAGVAKTTGQTQAQIQAQDNSGWTLVSVMRSFAAGFSLGLSEIMLLVKRCLAGVVAFVVLLPCLILAVMACWKIIQACIGIFSHLAIYVAVVTLAGAFAIALGPLAFFTYLTEEFKRYGQAFVSFWLQALAGSIVLGVAVKLAVIGFGNLSLLCISAGSAVVAALMGGNVGIGSTMLQGVIAALPFVAAGFALDFFAQFIQKAPTAGIGQISGSFQP